jgi:hypothetical protein
MPVIAGSAAAGTGNVPGITRVARLSPGSGVGIPAGLEAMADKIALLLLSFVPWATAG